ncbi:hypothetical protein ACLESD_52050, partial [Pyxidicoccus sp. 3LFB2]
GRPARAHPRRTGRRLRRGDLGLGGYVRAGRLGGEGLRWDIGDDFSMPTLELNATGFQRTQNEHAPSVALRYHRGHGLGTLKSLSASLQGGAAWTTDGRALHRGNWANARVSAQLPSLDVVGLEVGGGWGGWDVRELGRTGVPLERDDNAFTVLTFESDASRPVSAGGFLAPGYHFASGPAQGRWGWGAGAHLALRPLPALETLFEVSNDRAPYKPRFVEDLGAHRFLLGTLEANLLSFSLRQNWVIAPRLTLQGQAQLFTAYGLSGPFFEATSNAERAPIRFSTLVPVERAREVGFRNVALNVNVVLRWEYRLGSTLFLVYSRAQEGGPPRDGLSSPATVWPRGLGGGPASDAVMMKWTYHWSR